MTAEHPITPPPELVNEWFERWQSTPMFDDPVSLPNYIAARAAQWGADMELKACCKQLDELQLGTCYPVTGDKLRAARRPQPPSLKKEALTQITQLVVELDRAGMRHQASKLEGLIRRAIEALPND
jgi:hypothetical protein